MSNTPQQQKTIDAPLGDILVSAAAGSGKTSVMTERIVTRIVQEQLDIRHVLVMTFTDAAAKNMRTKIEKRLRNALEQSDTEKHRYLAKQIAYLSQSSISTIHSFCLEVVRNFYYEAMDSSGNLLLEPGFRIEDPGETGILLAQALDDLFEEFYAQCDMEPESMRTKNFLFLVDAYGSSKGDGPLRALLLSFYHFLRSMPDYKGWIESQKEILEQTVVDFDHSDCCKALLEGLKLRTEKAAEGMEDLKNILTLSPVLYKSVKKNVETLEVFQSFYTFMEKTIKIIREGKTDWDTLYLLFEQMPEVPVLKKSGGLGIDSPEKTALMELFTSHFAEFLHYTTGRFGTPKYASQFIFAKSFVFTKTKKELTEELSTMLPAIRWFLDIAVLLDEEYTRSKRKANMIDFGDFEHIALNILKNENVRNYYRDKFQEIYLDEYQDTSSIQEAILEQISTGNCFMVGDVKQSIYKFRHARPRIFMDKMEKYIQNDSSASQGDATLSQTQDVSISGTGTVYELNKNFRSVKGILSAVNEVFYQIMSKKAGEIDYDVSQALVWHRKDDKNTSTPVEILLVDLSQEPDAKPVDDSSADGSEENGKEESANGDENGGVDEADDVSDSVLTGQKAIIEDENSLSKEEKSRYEKEALAVALKIKELLESEADIETDIEIETETAIDADRNANMDKNANIDTRTFEDADHNAITNSDVKKAADIDKRIDNAKGKGKKNKITPGHIAVLARTRSICAIFAQTIKEFGFPVEQEQAAAFLEQYELKVIQSFLKILDNPMQDIPLVSVMRAPLFQNGFSEEELLAIRNQNRKMPYFYECCRDYADNGTDLALMEKVKRFYAWISMYREQIAYQTVSELLESLYTESGFLAHAATMPDGPKRVLSLQQFQDWAQSVDQSRGAGLYSFVRYMDAIQEKTSGQSPYGIEQSPSDSIKVMTMHRSKGLEYDVVFLVGNDRKISSKDTKDLILISEEYGIGYHYVDVKNQFRYPTPLVTAMREGMRNAEMAEEMRLFYVGMTRAENRLFISGTFNKESNLDGKGFAPIVDKIRQYPANEALPPHVVLSAKSTLEWIVMAIARNPFLDLTPMGLGRVENYENRLKEKVTFHSDAWTLHIQPYQKLADAADNILSASVPANTNDEPFCEIPRNVTIEDLLYKDPLEQEMERLYKTKFQYKYPYETATNSPLKISVSEIKRREQEQLQDATPEIPGIGVLGSDYPLEKASFEHSLKQRGVSDTIFENKTNFLDVNDFEKETYFKDKTNNLGDEVLSPRGINTTLRDWSTTSDTKLDKREIGIAVHSFFRYLDLDRAMKDPTPKTIEEQMKTMHELGMLHTKEYEALLQYTDAFEGYLQSPLAARIHKAEQQPSALYREIPFTIKLDSETFFKMGGFGDKDSTFVQGMIDCWFLEDGEAVLVDYKTDLIKGNNSEIALVLANRYHTQLAVYTNAIEEIMGYKVKETIIWLVENKTAYPMEYKHFGRK